MKIVLWLIAFVLPFLLNILLYVSLLDGYNELIVLSSFFIFYFAYLWLIFTVYKQRRKSLPIILMLLCVLIYGSHAMYVELNREIPQTMQYN